MIFLDINTTFASSSLSPLKKDRLLAISGPFLAFRVVNTPWLRRSRGSPSGDSGRGDQQSVRGGSAGVAVRATVGVMLSVPRCGCRWALPGCPARPHSRRLWSGHCGLRSELRSSIPAGQARCCRRVVPHNGSRCRTSSPVLGAMCRSGLQTTAGRDALLSSG